MLCDKKIDDDDEDKEEKERQEKFRKEYEEKYFEDDAYIETYYYPTDEKIKEKIDQFKERFSRQELKTYDLDKLNRAWNSLRTTKGYLM